MSSDYQIFFDNQPADADFYTAIASLEVEENMDLPGAVELNLPVSRKYPLTKVGRGSGVRNTLTRVPSGRVSTIVPVFSYLLPANIMTAFLHPR